GEAASVPCAPRKEGAGANSGHPWPSDSRALLPLFPAVLGSLYGARAEDQEQRSKSPKANAVALGFSLLLSALDVCLDRK
ncbi:MAG TPA: hypothetical protein VK753_12585, partial [Xanthomonadaceae bacterium]|nr:hypothetical protein [Xanthomonadaceae bacterium]